MQKRPPSEHPSFDSADGEAQGRSGSIGRCGDSGTRSTKASTSDGLSSAFIARPSRHRRFCQSDWCPSQDKDGHTTSTDGPTFVPRRRASSPAGARRFSAVPTCSPWRSSGWKCNPSLDSAESGRDSVGGPFDRPRKLCGPLFRKQLLPFNKRNSKKGEAPVRARPSLRELHAARCPGGLSQNEANRCPASDLEGVPRPVAVHPLLREARRLPVAKGAGLSAMDDGSHRGLFVGGGNQRSPGVGFIGNGHDRPSLPRRREVGSSLPFGVVGGPTTGVVCSQRQVHQPKVGSFLADLSTTVGDYNTVVHKRNGLDQYPQIGSSWSAFEKTTQGRRGDGQASTQEEASKVPEETKARPGPEVEDGGRGCMFFGR